MTVVEGLWPAGGDDGGEVATPGVGVSESSGGGSAKRLGMGGDDSSGSGGGSLNCGRGGNSSSSGGGSLNAGRLGVDSSSAAGGGVGGFGTSSTGFSTGGGGGTLGTGASSWTGFGGGFFAACCIARSCCVSAPKEMRLRLSLTSTGAVRLRSGTLRVDSRFFLAMVGGMMESYFVRRSMKSTAAVHQHNVMGGITSHLHVG